MRNCIDCTLRECGGIDAASVYRCAAEYIIYFFERIGRFPRFEPSSCELYQQSRLCKKHLRISQADS
nr:unnamed protein product [Callosobruchus analis]